MTTKRIDELTELPSALTSADNYIVHDENTTTRRVPHSTLARDVGQAALNVKTFGAVGDGVTIDTVAIQTAINAARDGSIKTVFFPEGTYIIDAPLMMVGKEYSGVRLIGSGCGSNHWTLKTDLSDFDLPSASTMLKVLDTVSPAIEGMLIIRGVLEDYIWPVQIEVYGICFNCYGKANVGIEIQSIAHSVFSNIDIIGSLEKGLWSHCLPESYYIDPALPPGYSRAPADTQKCVFHSIVIATGSGLCMLIDGNVLGSPTDHDTCMCEFTNIHTSQLDNDGLVFANCDCNTITTVTTFRPKSPKYAKHTTAKYPSGGPWGPADNISYRGFGIRLKGSAQNSKGNCRQNTFINIQPGQAGILAEVNDTGTNTTKNVILLQNDGNAGFDAHPETECAKISVAGGNGDFLGVVKPALDGVEGIGEIEILDPGTGYTGSPVVTFSAPNNVRVPSAARVTAAATAHTDGVSKITVTAMGSGYAANPTVTISGGGGTGAVAIPHVSGGGYLTRIEITNPGAGYTSAPTITISEGGGSGATATARIDGISYFTITNTGHGYRPAHLVVQNAFSSGPAQPTVMPDPRQPWVSQFVWAEQMQAQHSGESLRLYSGGNESSANQLRLVCNSDSASYEQDVDWKINASNNGDMNIVRMGGSGKLNLPWQLKYAGLDVSVGADDSGGTGYAVLRIPNI